MKLKVCCLRTFKRGRKSRRKPDIDCFFQRSENDNAMFSLEIFPQKFKSNEIESGVLEKSQEINNSLDMRYS